MTLSALNHLPTSKQRELKLAVQILFDSFDDAIKTKLSAKRKSGEILKIILFGSSARGDWVDDKTSGYTSDFDLLVIVKGQIFTDLHEYWGQADARFIREQTITHHIKTPVSFIVHDLAEVNDQLARGRPFFSDIAKDGIILYEAPGHPLARPKPLSSEEIRLEAQAHYDQWYPKADYNLKLARYSLADNQLNHAAFNLHQAVESLFHCVLLVKTLYSPKSHRLTVLRSQAENLDQRLKDIWPSDTKLHRQAFDRLRRAYVEARYSHNYLITQEELDWLNARVQRLQETVKLICEESLTPRDAILP